MLTEISRMLCIFSHIYSEEKMGKNMYRTVFIYEQQWLLSVEESRDWKEAYWLGDRGAHL